MQFLPLSCYFVPLRPKNFTQHSILEHHQPIFRSQYDRPISPLQVQSVKLSTCNSHRKHGIFVKDSGT